MSYTFGFSIRTDVMQFKNQIVFTGELIFGSLFISIELMLLNLTLNEKKTLCDFITSINSVSFCIPYMFVLRAGSRSDFKICNICCVLCYTKTFDKMQINRQEKKSLENYASRIEMPHTVHVCMSPLY